MNPVTALGHLVLAGLLWRSVRGGRKPLDETIARWLGSGLAVVGAYQLLALLTGWVPRLDRALFGSAGAGGGDPGRRRGLGGDRLGIRPARAGPGPGRQRTRFAPGSRSLGSPGAARLAGRLLLARALRLRKRSRGLPRRPRTSPWLPARRRPSWPASIGFLAALPGWRGRGPVRRRVDLLGSPPQVDGGSGARADRPRRLAGRGGAARPREQLLRHQPAGDGRRGPGRRPAVAPDGPPRSGGGRSAQHADRSHRRRDDRPDDVRAGAGRPAAGRRQGPYRPGQRRDRDADRLPP